MLSGPEIAPGAAALDEAKAYLRIASGEEDALLTQLVQSAATIGERFTGQVLIARALTETLAAGAAWRRLTATPIAAIAAVSGVGEDGAAALPADAYAVDIDGEGDGWIRLTAGAATVSVALTAGMAADWLSLPAPLRQGIVVLAAHLYDRRDGAEALPAAVTALWRPFRRLRLAERVPA